MLFTPYKSPSSSSPLPSPAPCRSLLLTHLSLISALFYSPCVFTLSAKPALLFHLPPFSCYDLTFYALSIILCTSLLYIFAPQYSSQVHCRNPPLYALPYLSLSLHPSAPSLPLNDEWILPWSLYRKLDAFIYDAAVLNYMARKDEGCKVSTNPQKHFCLHALESTYMLSCSIFKCLYHVLFPRWWP